MMLLLYNCSVLQEYDSMKKFHPIKYVFVGVLSLSIIEYSIATVDQ